MVYFMQNVKNMTNDRNNLINQLPTFIDDAKNSYQTFLFGRTYTPEYLNGLHDRVLKITRGWKYYALLFGDQRNQLPGWKKLSSLMPKLLVLYCIQMVQALNESREKNDFISLLPINNQASVINTFLFSNPSFGEGLLPERFKQGIQRAFEIISKPTTEDTRHTTRTLQQQLCEALDYRVYRDMAHLQRVSDKNRQLALTAHNLSESGSNDLSQVNINVGIVQTQRYTLFHAITIGCGTRLRQEDTYQWGIVNGISYFTVFDGHNGNEASEYAKTRVSELIQELLGNAEQVDPVFLANAIHSVCLQLNREIVQQSRSGTTATIAFLQDNHLVVGTVGDSEAVLGREDGRWERLTPAANCDASYFQRQVYQRGGTITARVNALRVDGYINMTHTLGDRAFASLSARPIISYTVLSNQDVVILASDGVWNDVTPKQAVRISYDADHPAQRSR